MNLTAAQKREMWNWVQAHQPARDKPAGALGCAPGFVPDVEPKRCCYSCKQMRHPREYEFPSALRCKSCDRSSKIAQGFASRLYQMVGGSSRGARILGYLGCSREAFLRHLEGQFVEGMGWHNRSEWHIDHILPVSSFDHTQEKEIRKCWHYSNLRPLWAALNLKKSKRLDSGI